MATQEQIDIVKGMLPPDAATYGWDDAKIETLIDALISNNRIVLQYWELTAARMSKMVDTAESGSSRKMSDLFDNAIAMAKYWKGIVEDEETPIVVPVVKRSGTRPINRV